MSDSHIICCTLLTLVLAPAPALALAFALVLALALALALLLLMLQRRHPEEEMLGVCRAKLLLMLLLVLHALFKRLKAQPGQPVGCCGRYVTFAQEACQRTTTYWALCTAAD